MDCTEAYKEHIMYSFNGFCKVVIRYAAINAWRDRNRRWQEQYCMGLNSSLQNLTKIKPVRKKTLLRTGFCVAFKMIFIYFVINRNICQEVP